MSASAKPLWAALAFTCVAGVAHAQTSTDAAWERLEAINGLRLGIFRPLATLALHSNADASAGFGAGVALVSLEKRGSAWEGVRLDSFRGWTHGEADVAFTLLDVTQEMLGTDVDHDACLAALPVLFLGDCQHGGVFGFRAQLLHHAYESESHRWFHRWFELGAVLSFFGNSFDVDFVRARLPLTLGVSLDQVANIRLPAGEAPLHLRGVASLAFVLRVADYAVELTGAFDFRPSLAPFDVGDDYALAARARVAYVWLGAWFGAIRGAAQRVYFEVQASHWEKPWLADQPFATENNLELTIGFELTLRNLTPS